MPKLLYTGSTVQITINSGKPYSSSLNLIHSPATIQRPPVSPILVAPVITVTIIPQPIHVLDSTDIEPHTFPLPPPP